MQQRITKKWLGQAVRKLLERLREINDMPDESLASEVKKVCGYDPTGSTPVTMRDKLDYWAVMDAIPEHMYQ